MLLPGIGVFGPKPFSVILLLAIHRVAVATVNARSRSMVGPASYLTVIEALFSDAMYSRASAFIRDKPAFVGIDPTITAHKLYIAVR